DEDEGDKIVSLSSSSHISSSSSSLHVTTSSTSASHIKKSTTIDTITIGTLNIQQGAHNKLSSIMDRVISLNISIFALQEIGNDIRSFSSLLSQYIVIQSPK